MRSFRWSHLFVILMVVLQACTPGRSASTISPTLAQPEGSKAATPENPLERTAEPSEPGASPILLNEVLFLPKESAPQFIELKNSGNLAVQAGGIQITNEKGISYTLPAGTGTIPAGGVLLILFDGNDQVDATAVHSSLVQFLDTQSGFITLSAPDGATLDRVAWGEQQLYPVRLSRGGILTDLAQGTSIGRFPLSVANDPQEWVTFAPDQVSPDAMNPTPGVEALLPLSGAILTEPQIELSWYLIAGAAQYRVQFASDQAFTDPIIDQTVTAPPLQIDQPAPGDYYWRVQAIAADGAAATFSQPNVITTAQLAAPAQNNALAVPMIIQHKDTAMLMLESQNETGAHAWDKDHQTLDQNDPSDNMNCALASTAMVNAFYGGKLSQDRIGYEIYKNKLPGPEQDLNYGFGVSISNIARALQFALGAAASTHRQPYTSAQFWAVINNEIDAGRPVVATTSTHAFVIIGYSTTNGKQMVTINDPWSGSYQVDLTNPQASGLNDQFDTYFLLPAAVAATSDEPEISQDSDGDGVVDFDETQRLHTNPNDADTDQDRVNDKPDLRASIFDTKHGYALYHPEGRDFDSDGIDMELDEDSDAGGCFDGLEDLNGNGKNESNSNETYNFKKGDEACISGTDEISMDITTTSEGTINYHQSFFLLAVFSARPGPAGSLEGFAQVTYEGEGTSLLEDCPGIYSVGPFVWGAELKGVMAPQQDGTTIISLVATPSTSPDYFFQWDSPCSSEGEAMGGVGWGGVGGTLEDGVFDVLNEFPVGAHQDGEYYQLIHIEQSKGGQ